MKATAWAAVRTAFFFFAFSAYLKDCGEGKISFFFFQVLCWYEQETRKGLQTSLSCCVHILERG